MIAHKPIFKTWLVMALVQEPLDVLSVPKILSIETLISLNSKRRSCGLTDYSFTNSAFSASSILPLRVLPILQKKLFIDSAILLLSLIRLPSTSSAAICLVVASY